MMGSSFLTDSDHELCFDREIFFSRSFSVDKFVCEKRKAVGLEQLRQDLRSHLTYLQECLIELINEHYTDFVNLSSNLVGLEKFIGNISTPLTKLRDEVADINALIDDLLEETQEKLDRRQKDRQLKGQTLLALEVYRGVQRLPNGNIQWDMSSIDRAASQIHSLSLSLERCKDIPLARKSMGIIQKLKDQMQVFLQNEFSEALNNHDEAHLRQILQIGVSIDRVEFLEKYHSEKIAKPALEDIVTERVLREVLSDGLFNQVLMFVTTTTSLLNRCASSEYDFILRSIFPVLVSLAEARVPTLFSLTSATMFHLRYCEAQRFLETLEQNLPNEKSVRVFRGSEPYKKFINKWSTGVYFQLRYTEIATNFETALLQGNDPFQFRQSRLSATENLHKQIQHCWSESVYIDALKAKFLKLTLQLVSRYTSFMEKFVDASHPSTENSAITLFHAASDCHQLNRESICAHLGSYLKGRELELFSDCLEDSIERLKICSDRLSAVAVGILGQLMNANIKQIMDIPRLYRRTNRELPKTPSSYVNALFKPVFECRSSTKHWSQKWSETLAQKVCESFLVTTRDVLDSVRKMEDSLRRLKKGKIAETQGISDDDKIRLQFMIDVEHFGELLVQLGHKPEIYEELFELTKNQMNEQ